MKKKVVIWCETLIALYSAKPVISKYLAQEREVFLVVQEKNREIVAEYIDTPAVKILAIETLDSAPRRRLSVIVQALISSLSFSPMFHRLRKKQGWHWKNLLGMTVARLFSPRMVNRIYHQIFSCFPNKLPAYFLVSFTRVTKPYLLASKKLRHIAIMESWDHPVKAPWYTEPSFTLTWNRDLKQDIKSYQNVGRVGFIAPLKFRYINELQRVDEQRLLEQLGEPFTQELLRIVDRPFVLYPTTTSSVNPPDHPGELELIADLAKATDKLGLTLYIKPKPNGPERDYDTFQGIYNVIVGKYSSDVVFSDMLQTDYHIFRYLLLKRAEVVVNVGTTFVLEAALAGAPVLQLNLFGERFGHFVAMSKNVHLQKYLLGLPSSKYDGKIADLVTAIQSRDSLECGFLLRQWLTEGGRLPLAGC